jgi:uncharacterized membrane protein
LTQARFLCAALTLLLGASTAQAQETGGSFGGGDWGDSSGSSDYGSSSSDYGSSSSSDYGSSSSSDYGSYDSSSSAGTSSGYSGSGGSGSDAAAFTGVFIAGLLILAMFVFAYLGPIITRLRGGRGGNKRAQLGGRLEVAVDVTRLQLGIDHRARKFVQDALMKLAKSGETKSKAGRRRLLEEAVRTLQAVEPAWLYAGANNARPMPPGKAREAFTQLADDARTSFRQELVRNVDGVATEAAAVGVSAKAHEGDGVVVVSVIVAARRDLFDPRVERPGEITALLQRLGTLQSRELVAFEVIWSPAAEQDRMSTAELEARYPALVSLGGGLLGRVFCAYCAGPYTAELAKCPHCGAPSPSAPS